MQFGNPTMFWLLALVPVLILFLVAAFRARRRALQRLVAAPLAEKLAASVHRGARRWKAALLVAGCFFAVLALTQPRWGFEWREVKSRGVDIFVLLDVSKSMLAEDVKPSRLGQAKFAVEDLIKKLDGDRIGLVAFAGTAFVQCPLTVDYDAFRLTLKEAEPRVIPVGGSALGRAIRTALKAFESGEGRDHAIVLVTDGADKDEEGDAFAAADEAAKNGVHIYVIGVGGTGEERVPIREHGKALVFLKDKQGNDVKTRLNEEPLKTIAARTQSVYYKSGAGDFGLALIYDEGIARLRQSEYEARLQKKYFERFQWPLGLALLCLVIERFVGDRRKMETTKRQNSETARRDITVSGPTSNVRRRTAATVAAFSLLVAMSASADTAARLYDQGKYEEAFQRYKKLAEQESAKENWPLFYDLGVAAYKAGKAEESAKAFERALASPDPLLQQKTHYNLGNVVYRAGQTVEPQNLEGSLPLYERALKEYESSLAVDPSDADAKHNQEVAQRKIEEVKKKIEEQKDKGSGSEGKGDKGDKDQGEQNQQSKDEQKQPQQSQPEQADQQKEQQQQQRQQTNTPPPQQAQQPKAGNEQPQTSQPTQTNNLEQIQAQILLDNLREDERNWDFFPELQTKELTDSGEPEKDW